MTWLAFFIWQYHGVQVIKELLPIVICGFLLRLPVFVISFFFTGMAFISVLSLVARLTLNAELLNPFIAPILSVVAYFWKNWRWSVEAKCFQLKTLITEVSRDKVAATKDQQNQDKTDRNGDAEREGGLLDQTGDTENEENSTGTSKSNGNTEEKRISNLTNMVRQWFRKKFTTGHFLRDWLERHQPPC